MKTKYTLFRRGAMFYMQDSATGKQTSLRTKDETEAVSLLEARNAAQRQPVLNLHLARAYLTASDPVFAERTWQVVMEQTRFVEDQSIKAASEDSARGRALGFTMAMLQRRFASSIYAVRRSLQRMKEKREHILADPEGYRQSQINKRLPDDYEDLPEEEQQEIVSELEDLVASYDPAALRDEITELGKLIQKAVDLEKREVESKLIRLRELIKEYGIFQDPKMKLLIFTEHKDTLDFLCADGKDGRPLGKLREWGLSVTQIHGGMKIGDRDTPGSRIFAEREFKESAQVLVATEAAGEPCEKWLIVAGRWTNLRTRIFEATTRLRDGGPMSRTFRGVLPKELTAPESHPFIHESAPGIRRLWARAAEAFSQTQIPNAIDIRLVARNPARPHPTSFCCLIWKVNRSPGFMLYDI